MNTNGWTFWQYQNSDGSVLTLQDARQRARQLPQGERSSQDQPERYDQRKRFWECLLSRPKVKSTRHADKTADRFNWIAPSSGVRGLPFCYVIGRKEARVELYIDRGANQTEANKDIFVRLHRHRKQIEGDFGSELLWQRLDDKRACRLAYTLSVGGYKSDVTKWPGIQDAMIDAMVRLERALAPHLAKMKAELVSEGL